MFYIAVHVHVGKIRFVFLLFCFVAVPEFACPAEHWQCPDTTQCVPFASVCDQSNDCPNGEDEGSDCSELCLDYEKSIQLKAVDTICNYSK